MSEGRFRPVPFYSRTWFFCLHFAMRQPQVCSSVLILVVEISGVRGR